MADDLPEHRVAITVFATVQAVDERDGRNVAEIAIGQALKAAVDDAGDLTVRLVNGDMAVHVHGVMDTGVAAGNGYLWLRPTAKSFNESRGIT